MTALKTVTFGRPLNDLPESSSRHSYGPAAHWEAVATHCRQHPNLWMPVTITGMGKTSAAQAATAAATIAAAVVDILDILDPQCNASPAVTHSNGHYIAPEPRA